MDKQVGEGLLAALVSLILVAIISIPNYGKFSLAYNSTSAILLFGLFFGFSLLVEASYRDWKLAAEHRRHPTQALLLVLLSTTIMLFFFLGFLVRASLL